LTAWSSDCPRPKKFIKKALQIYLDQLTRAEYVQSYKQVANDTELQEMAEEGMEDYLKQSNA